MSSATSIDRGAGLQTRHQEAGPKTRPTKQEPESAADVGFHVWHFFVLLSLLAATLAVMMARQSTPQHLILISLAVGAAGLAAYAFYQMVVPFAVADRTSAAEPIGERLRADLEREKSLVLRSIKELEFDRAMGKLSVKDFDEMSGRLRSRAIGIMKQLQGGGYREIIERDLAVRLTSGDRTGSSSRPDLQVGRAASQPRTSNEQHAESTRADPKLGPTGVCVCGIQHDADAKFCKACGARLA
jgi:hypothetical protein